MTSIERNRTWWDGESDEYQSLHRGQLSAIPKAWGVWAIPESELNVLGDVSGKDVLEFGCGAAQWSIALQRQGARVTGMDLSGRQLAHAREAMAECGTRVHLVQAAGQDPPFADASFDVVFCDHGAMTFAPPERTVAEASRLLRPGGLFAFNMTSALLEITWDMEKDAPGTSLKAGYFGLHTIDEGDAISYILPTGEWIRLFRKHGLAIEDLIEIQAPEDATTTYTNFATPEWSRRWPAENLWKLRKESTP